jgi:hypothetical protein
LNNIQGQSSAFNAMNISQTDVITISMAIQLKDSTSPVPKALGVGSGVGNEHTAPFNLVVTKTGRISGLKSVFCSRLSSQTSK